MRKKGSGNIKSSLDDCDQRCTDQRRPDVPEPAKAGRGAEQITKKRAGLDRSRKEIVEYYGTPERIGSSLVLHDANILNIEDVSHLVE